MATFLPVVWVSEISKYEQTTVRFHHVLRLQGHDTVPSRRNSNPHFISVDPPPTAPFACPGEITPALGGSLYAWSN